MERVASSRSCGADGGESRRLGARNGWGGVGVGGGVWEEGREGGGEKGEGGWAEQDGLDSDWELVEPESFSFSRKRPVVCAKKQQDMSYEGTPVKAPPTSRRMMPPTPQQSSYSSIEATEWQTEMEDQGSGWNARERTVIANMEQYLNDSDYLKLEIEELELPHGPEDSEV